METPRSTPTTPLCFRSQEPIPRVPCPTKEEFDRDIAPRREPVILTGAMEGSRALQRWTPDQLAAAVGSREVGVYAIDEGRTFAPTAERKHVMMPFDEFVRRGVEASADAEGARRTRYYLTQCRDIAAAFPELAGDIPTVPVVSGVQETNLWTGSGDISIGAHQDIGVNNFHCHVFGRKRVVLFPPKDGLYLYPYGVQTGNICHSQVRDVDAPDLDRHPLFALAHARVGVLEPGDVLYIPVFWWHDFRTLTFSVSMNYFCSDPEFQSFDFAIIFDAIAAVSEGTKAMSPLYRDFVASRIASELWAG